MKHLLILLGVVCLAFMLLPSCAPPPEPESEAVPEPVFDQAAEEAAIREMLEQLLAAINRHDAQAVVARLFEDWQDWEGTIKGRAGREKQLTENFERQKDYQTNLLDEIGIVFVTPDVAIYKYHIAITGNLDADGKPLPPLKYLVAIVCAKKEGKWLIAATFGRPME